MAALSFVLSVLWWGFWLSLLAYVVGKELWARRPWRKPDEPFARFYDRLMAETRRKVEARQLKELEEAGVELWRPERKPD